METRKLVVKYNKDNYFDIQLLILNALFNLTEKEREVVANFMRLNKDSPVKTKDRKKVTEIMGFKNVDVLNNYIKRIVDKGVFIKTRLGYKYHPALSPKMYLNNISFELKFDG